MKIQWLIPIPNCTIEHAQKSNLASIRLRSALSSVEFINMGHEVTFTDGHGSNYPDTLLVGKIDNINTIAQQIDHTDITLLDIQRIFRFMDKNS